MTRNRKLFIDCQPEDPAPKPGDYLATVGKRGRGTQYRIFTVRQVKRRDPSACPRFNLEVRIVDDIPRTAKGAVILFQWYPRKKKSRDFEEYMKRTNPTHRTSQEHGRSN